MKVDMPPLAQYKNRSQYVPSYGDYIIWSGWFTQWHGIVTAYDDKSGDVSIIFAGIPYLLFTMPEQQYAKETTIIPLHKLQNAPNGKYAIQTVQGGNAIWYI